MTKDLHKQEALDYHSKGRPGKIEVVPTKEAKTQRDLSYAKNTFFRCSFILL